MNNYDKRMDEWIEKTFGSNQYGEDEDEIDWDEEIESNIEELETEREK